MGNLAHKAKFPRTWFFGTCFTWGYGCRPGYDFYKRFKKEGDERWTRHVCKELMCHEQIRAKPLYGTVPQTIKVLLNQLRNIRPGDLVIIEQGIPHGILKISEDKKSVQNAAHFDMSSDKLWFNEEDKRIGLEYLNHNIIGNEEVWSKYYREQIDDLRGLLAEKNVKSIVFDPDGTCATDQFERIRDVDKDSPHDLHYSWKGHKQVAEYILDKVRRKEFLKRTLV
jgi:hypothetical protein